jgi:Protein of unknown function (DUF3043)
VFGRNSKQADPDPVPVPDAAARPEAQAPKGRPTPSRKDAESSRRTARKIPSDPKAAKKAQKERARDERATARAGMVAGDKRFLPSRDQGPVRAYIREYVDGRRRMSEYFVFVAVGILVAGFARNPQVQSAVSFIWFGATGVIAVEMILTLVKLNKQLTERWPDKADRKGSMLYGGMRALQIRKLRVPAPVKKSNPA